MSAGRCQATILVNGVRHVCGSREEHRMHTWDLDGGVVVQSPYPEHAPRSLPMTPSDRERTS